MKKLNGTRRIFLSVAIVIISVVSIVSAYTLYHNIETLIIKEKGSKAMSVSVAVAKLVEQDSASFYALANVEDYDSDAYNKIYYEKMQRIFRDIREKSDVKYVYCCKRISEDQVIYIFDGEDPKSEFFSPLGAKDNLDALEEIAYKTRQPSFSLMINDSDWGELITGVAPVINPSNGDVIAHIGVDVSASQIKSSLLTIKNAIFLNSVILIIITTLIIYRLLCMSSSFTEIDYLTGLSSKGYMERFLEQLIKKSAATGKSFPMIMIDFDDFKLINDQFGHHFGDLVLKTVSGALRTCTRSVDCCARYGGDEFVMILPEANLEYASLVCNWLQKEVASLQLQAKNDSIISISISIGIALWEQGMTKEQIIVRADKALYLSKRTGKNKITIYEESSL